MWHRACSNLELGINDLANQHPRLRRLWPSTWWMSFPAISPSKGQEALAGDGEPNGWLLARPHRFAGTAHQMATWIAGYTLAQRYGLALLPAAIDHRWAQHLHLDAHYGPAAPASAKRIRLPSISGDWDSAGIALLDAIVRRDRVEPAVFVLAYDQHWWDMRSAEGALRAAYWHGRDDWAAEFPNGRLSIHVRRGDIREMVGTAAGDQAWMDSEWFAKVARRCVEERLQEGRALSSIEVSSQEFDPLLDGDLWTLGLPVGWILSDDPIEAFRSLASAEILLGSPSGFSYLAGMVNRGTVVMPEHFWHPLPENDHWRTASRLGELSDGVRRRK